MSTSRCIPPHLCRSLLAALLVAVRCAASAPALMPAATGVVAVGPELVAVSVQTDAPALVHVAVVAAGAEVPTASQVASGEGAVASGGATTETRWGLEAAAVMRGLRAGTGYQACIATEAEGVLGGATCVAFETPLQSAGAGNATGGEVAGSDVEFLNLTNIIVLGCMVMAGAYLTWEPGLRGPTRALKRLKGAIKTDPRAEGDGASASGVEDAGAGDKGAEGEEDKDKPAADGPRDAAGPQAPSVS